MVRDALPDDPKARARRRQRALDMRRLRARQRRGVWLLPIEVGAEEVDWAIRFGALKESQVGDRTATAAAMGRMLRRAMLVLLRENDRRR
jgi:hypothetical protein